MKYAYELFARVGVVACGVLFLQHSISLMLSLRHGGASHPDSIDASLFGIGLLAFLLASTRLTKTAGQA